MLLARDTDAAQDAVLMSRDLTANRGHMTFKNSTGRKMGPALKQHIAANKESFS